LPNARNCIITYGSIQFTKALSKQCVYIPGAYGFSKDTDCSNYYSKIPAEYLLNYPYVFLTWAEIKRSQDFLVKTFENDLFVRPNSGSKVFPGQVIEYSAWNETIQIIESTSSVVDETLVLVAAKHIIEEDEYRFVIVDRKVVAGSKYNWNKECSEKYSVEAEALAQIIADQEWQLDTAYTCDIAMTTNGPKVLELNSFGCAGLYACDRVKIVDAINIAAVKDHTEIFGAE
jgi:hypothetical protein